MCVTVRERRLTFGEVAEAYDRARPAYPAALVDDVAELSGASRALEVGAGTGKATVLFAQRGISVVALEPSAPMAAVARRNCEGYPEVRIEEVEFESWVPDGRGFALLYAAQAWHWVAPEQRYPRARAALAPGGLLAPFWTRVDWEECELVDPLRGAFDRVGAEHVPSDAMDPRQPRKNADWPGRWNGEIDGAAGLHDPQTRVYRWTQGYSAAEYVTLLATHSPQLVREAPAREALLDSVGEAIDSNGGRIVIPYQTELCLARAL